MLLSYNVVLSNDAPKIPKKPSPSLAELIQNPRHAGGPETCRVESQQVPHTLRSELPGECLWSWNYPNWTGQSYFQLIPTLTGSTQLAKYSKFLLAYRFETCSPSEPPNPELCSALHRMPPLWCEPALYPGKCLGLQFISKFICKFHWCAKGLIDVYWSFCRHTYTTCINSYIYIYYIIYFRYIHTYTRSCVYVYIYMYKHIWPMLDTKQTSKSLAGWGTWCVSISGKKAKVSTKVCWRPVNYPSMYHDPCSLISLDVVNMGI